MIQLENILLLESTFASVNPYTLPHSIPTCKLCDFGSAIRKISNPSNSRERGEIEADIQRYSKIRLNDYLNVTEIQQWKLVLLKWLIYFVLKTLDHRLISG
jgi:hypothetical protein